MAEKKEVLCVYRDRRRPVTFTCVTNESDIKQFLQAFQEKFTDVLDEGSSSMIDQPKKFVIEVESEEWGCLIEASDPVEDHAKLYVRNMEIETKGKELCKTLKRPSDASARVLASLFPSTKKRKFNPAKQSPADDKHRKKKAFGVSRRKTVTAILLKNPQAVLPKGQAKKQLELQGRVKKLHFARDMTVSEVGDVIIGGFSQFKLSEYQYLRSHQNNSLTNPENQELDGNGVLSLVGQGSLYLVQSKKVPKGAGSVCSSTSDQSSTSRDPGSSSNTAEGRPSSVQQSGRESVDCNKLVERATALHAILTAPRSPLREIGDSFSSDEDDLSDSVTQDKLTNYKIEELRKIRMEQDKAYMESLAADQKKEEEMRKRLELKERTENLRDEMKTKFDKINLLDGTPTVRIAFRFLDGAKVQGQFPEDSFVKDLYQFALSCEQATVIPFDLYTTLPRELVPLSQAYDGIVDYANALMTIERSCMNEEQFLEQIQDLWTDGNCKLHHGSNETEDTNKDVAVDDGHAEITDTPGGDSDSDGDFPRILTSTPIGKFHYAII